MNGYVRRINAATLNVSIGGVRIGHAKYTRLAQINLRTRIITFSRYAIENVPEQCRRYLVVHELSHVKEARHNKRFWDIVGKYVPDCRRVEIDLQKVFQDNIRDRDLAHIAPAGDALRRLENTNLWLPNNRMAVFPDDFDGAQSGVITDGSDGSLDDAEDACGCFDDEYDANNPNGAAFGALSGGAELDCEDGSLDTDDY